MKKTLQIHIGGRHFHIDEDGFNKLNHYLESLKAHFASEGDTGNEIVEDIEQRVAELLENKITENKQAISLEDIQEIIKVLGKVEDFVYNGQSMEEPESDHYERRDNRRLYRDGNNSYFGGVASGLGAYFDIDPLWIRLAFVGLFFIKGLGLLIYLILWIVVPKARSTAERLQMQGKPVNLSTIKDSVNAEYDKIKTGFDRYSHSSAADRTRSALENLLRAAAMIIVAFFKFLIGAVGVFFLVIGSIFLAGLILVLFGFTDILGHFYIWNGVNLPELSQVFTSTQHYYLVVISLIVLILIPIVALIYAGIKILFNIKTQHRTLRAFVLTAWLLALILFVTMIVLNVSNNAIEASDSETVRLEISKQKPLQIQVRDNTEYERMTVYRVFNYRFNYSNWNESLYSRPELFIELSPDSTMHVTVEKHAKNVLMENSHRYLNRIYYDWREEDAALYLDKFLKTDDDDFWMFASADIKLSIPEGQVIVISEEACDLLEPDQRRRYCSDSLLAGKKSMMTMNGLTAVAKQKTPLNRNK